MEREAKDPKPKSRMGPVENKVVATPEALRFWSGQGFGE